MPAGTLETLAVNGILLFSAGESQALCWPREEIYFGICVFIYIRGRGFPAPSAAPKITVVDNSLFLQLGPHGGL